MFSVSRALVGQRFWLRVLQASLPGVLDWRKVVVVLVIVIGPVEDENEDDVVAAMNSLHGLRLDRSAGCRVCCIAGCQPAGSLPAKRPPFAIRTLAEGNRVIWALKRMLRRAA